MAPSTRRDSELIRTARNVLRLQRAIAKYRRQIKSAKADLKQERKILRGLAYAAEQPFNTIPMRAHGGTTGLIAPDMKRPKAAGGADITEGFEG